MQKNGIKLLILMTTVLIILSGCFQGEQSLQEIDSPENQESDNSSNSGENNDANNEENNDVEAEASDEEVVTETVPRQLYLMDVNGMIAEQTLELPKLDSKEVATQVLSYLVKDGPVTSLLPNGFQAVLPAGTEILGLNLQEDGTLIVDVSEEFKNYEPEDELKILESMTYTLTQFDSVDKIQLQINGHPQDVMPINGTPIGEGYSRVNGINIIDTDTVDLMNSKAVTMYYPTEYNDNRYYVPVTKHIEVNYKDPNMFESIVHSLLDGPGYYLNLSHVFNMETSLLNNPTLKDGVLELVFSQDILKDKDKAVISDEVMETLVRTLTEQHSVDAVQVKVEDFDTIVNENGEVYTEPVSNSTFTTKEKL